jgi:geranylgeranyl pyrophosphate synthase
MGPHRLNKTISFLAPVQEDIQAVEALMRSQADEHHPDLKAALELLVSSGGKRIRPALTLLGGRMLGAQHEALVTLAAAIELLHTATLVHDDLIDNSFLRRGIPTLNSKWSPGATVLTGDFVFSRAAMLAADTNSIPVMKLFSQTLSIIVNGEIIQLFDSRCNPARDDYYRRIYAKTASLFETSAKAAALVAQADSETIEQMRCYGFEIGMAFQIIDDILDFTGEQVKIGKPVGSDLRQGLVTLPALVYIENHPEDLVARNLLHGECPHDENQLQKLVEAIRTSDAIRIAHDEAREFVQRGLESLRKLPLKPERESLEELAEYIVERTI